MNRYKPTGWRGEPFRHHLAAKGISTKQSPLSMSRFMEDVKKPASENEQTDDVNDCFVIAAQQQTASRDKYYSSKLASMFKNEEGEKEKQSLRQQDIQRKRAEVIGKLNDAVGNENLTSENREFFVEQEMSRLNKMYENGVMNKEEYDKEMDKKLDDFLSLHSRKFRVFDFGEEK